MYRDEWQGEFFFALSVVCIHQSISILRATTSSLLCSCTPQSGGVIVTAVTFAEAGRVDGWDTSHWRQFDHRLDSSRM